MQKAEILLHQVERHICEAECCITRQQMVITKLEQGGRTAAVAHARDLLTATLASLEASWAHRRALLLERY
ncbi:MAG: hypothetical protein JO139_10335 [Alphaproteobacteria bacterium]|nr:hypothetical protein [Alphaproteobacteria bacterium]